MKMASLWRLLALGLLCESCRPFRVAQWSSQPKRAFCKDGSSIGHIQMIEAYDLLPVVECLKLSNFDEVQACLDTLSPWLSISESGDVVASPQAINGFIGGSVGVIGTVAATSIKKSEVKDRLKCTYCDGTGKIMCGYCYGTKQTPFSDSSGAWQSSPCSNCEATGDVVCINCQGSGITIPDEIMQVLGDEEKGFDDNDYIGLFNEVKFPTLGSTMPAPNERNAVRPEE